MELIIWLVNCISICYVMKSFKRNKQNILLQGILLCLPLAILSVMLLRIQTLFAIFYFVIYISKIYIFRCADQNYRKCFVLINMSFVTVLSWHLISIASIALIYHQDMSSIISNVRFVIPCFMLYLLLDTIINIFITLKKDKLTKFLSNDFNLHYRSFEYFLWFCSIFLITQSILCQYDYYPIYISIFMICNDLLLFILILSFIKNIYEISRQAYIEKERDTLQKESERRIKNMEDLKTCEDIDILTNAYSRKFTYVYLEKLKKANIMFSIVFIDLDHLKSINDIYGHSVGDQYLRSFAESMEVFLNEGDILGRIGGDEFLLIMKYVDKDQATDRMKKIRNKILENTNVHQKAVHFSCGIATFKNDRQEIQTLIQEADKAMYQDKMMHRRNG